MPVSLPGVDSGLDAGLEDRDLAGGASDATESVSLQTARERSSKLERELTEAPNKFRMLTGDRPTGPLHIGHFFGTLANRVLLQNRGVETMVLIADYQVITDRDSIGPLEQRVLDIVADYLSVGIDESRSTIFAHSAVPALNQLMLPFLSLVTDSELRRNPTVKAELLAAGNRPMSGLMLTYPVHQAADILFCKANVVPVGRDQLPHVEQARTIARRFDTVYGRIEASQPLFPEPEALLSEGSNILGIDGQKMGKSRGNSVDIGMSDDETAARIRRAVTDSERNITFDPLRRPEVANLLTLLSLCTGRSPEEHADEIGHAGAGRLKSELTDALIEKLAPIRSRRSDLVGDREHLRSVLRAGNQRANEVASATLEEVRQVMHMNY